MQKNQLNVNIVREKLDKIYLFMFFESYKYFEKLHKIIYPFPVFESSLMDVSFKNVFSDICKFVKDFIILIPDSLILSPFFLSLSFFSFVIIGCSTHIPQRWRWGCSAGMQLWLSQRGRGSPERGLWWGEKKEIVISSQNGESAKMCAWVCMPVFESFIRTVLDPIHDDGM